MEMNDLKRQLARARGEQRSRYPAALRQAVIVYAQRRRLQKVSRDAVAAELGMSVATLSYWCAPKRVRGRLEPVTIVKAEPGRDVVVECGPLRVIGLDVVSVAELLRRLA